MFAYQGGVIDSTTLAEGVKTEVISMALDTVKVPLTVTVYPDNEKDTYTILLEYDDAMYSEQDMRTFGKALACYSENALKGNVLLGNIPMTAGEERNMVVALGRGKTLEFDTTETLVSIFKAQAKKTPDNTIVVFRDRNVSYKEADEITDRMARQLVKRGLKHEQAVGVMIERSELMFLFSMAVMKAGGSYMPLDPHFPEDRLTFMCEDAGVSIILTADGLARKVLPSFAGDILERADIDIDDNAGITLPEVKANDRMVILFTSGSTGKPKGVELEQHGIVNYIHWYVKEFEMTADDRAVGYANYGFDAHMIDIYPPMLVGACCYILPEELRMDLTAMNDYIEQNNLTIAFMTTQIGCQMATLFDNKSLRVLSTGGEKMPPITPPKYRFVNPYGPTECSLFSTFYDVKSYFEGEFIGGPLDNYQLYVIDTNRQLLPAGVPGELLIAGTAVARGYLNRPDLTAEKFIEFDGQRAYRSGDLVRWSIDPRDGSWQIEFLGRIDNQVKLRGLRIELSEIENQVSRFEGIRQNVVDVKEVNGVQHLCCYYTLKAFQC